PIPKPKLKESGDTAMTSRQRRERIGNFATPISNITSILLPIVLCILLVAPQIQGADVVFQSVPYIFFIYVLIVLVPAWLIANVLSGRWGTGGWRKADALTSWICFACLALLVAYLL